MAGCTGRSVSAPSSGLASQVGTAAAPAGSAAMRWPSPLVISVAAFEDRANQSDLIWLRKGMADMLVAEFARNPSVLVVQRDRMEEVMREQAFQLSGRVADDSVVRVGRMAGATVLVAGSFAVVNGWVRIDAQLLGVERGTVLGTASAEGSLADASATAQALVAKIVASVPAGSNGSAAYQGVGGEASAQAAMQAAKANDRGEGLTREGKLWQALEEFERGMAADPSNPSLHANYARTVAGLPGADLARFGGVGVLGGAKQVVGRVMERLSAGGIEAEVERPRLEEALDGTVTVRLPVRLRLAPSAVAAIREMAAQSGGNVEEADPLVVTLSGQANVNREFTRRLAVPHRILLRLLAVDGRTLAVYSAWKEWKLGTWIAPIDEQRVRLQLQRLVRSEAVFAGIPADQASTIAGIRVTVEPSARERATVSVETVELDESRPGMEKSAPLRYGQWQGGSETKADGRKAHRPAAIEPAASPRFEVLRASLEAVWDPGVAERPWGHGYLPGNERTVVIVGTADGASGRLQGEPRILKASGDQEFDHAALASVRVGWQQWEQKAVADQGSGTAHPSAPVKVRMQFRVIKDLPPLNMIGPLETIVRWPTASSPAPSSR